MNRTCSILLSSAFLPWLLWFANTAAGQEWTRFRGPNGTGESDAATIPTTWTTNDYNWRVKLPGIGYSSPVILNDRIFVISADESNATRFIRCLRTADGGLIWKRSFPSVTYSKNQLNSYDAASPVVDQHHVYMTWATPQEYIVLALDHNKGRDVWRRDLGPFKAQHGFGASPILFEDVLIVANDQDGPSFVIALDRMTGNTRWKAERRVERAAYSTPCIYRPDQGPPQLILTSSANGVTGLDPSTGEKIWELDVFRDRVVGSPLVAAGMIFASSGQGGGGKRLVAVRPGNPANGVRAELAYDHRKTIPYVPTPVASGRLLFLFTDSGVAICMDAPTGKIHWQQRVGGRFFGSPVRVADRIYCISRQGEMIVLAAADEFNLLSRISLEERSNSTPAVANGVMYLRTASHLMSLGGKKQ